MSFEDGMKGFTFGIIALICWAVGIILGLLKLGGIFSSILGLAVLVFAILAFVYGRKEFALDPTNKKAKTGKTIGLVVIILEIVFLVLTIVLVGVFASLMIAG
ncbi:hypothetical protein [Acetobacterium woodii]|uniref:Uncharacterized protein n=1 Tax=Acetobacterium woodii (strain ATCC 29683 / DSM 1030 / JCM 2381 / KCTC 1655 / WB1) TaxID=931626 RepID=H6LJ62_ACEWD|nr:hypothetical protein [Acetobacterium woodii]AFA47425.1 hypothetical protein Awo_c06270 [Acetobacterium woodii DSM 1030]